MALPIPSSLSPPWIELPKDLTANILKRLNSLELIESAQFVCSTWWNVCKDPAMWRVIDMKYLNVCKDSEMWKVLDTKYLNGVPYERAEKMCHEAVDRSQGQLIDINIAYFGTDKLLQHISNQSTQLRCLGITYSDISGKYLVEAVKNFPHLEELHLFFMSALISARDIETIGLSCPMLKSFSFNDRGFQTPLFRSNDYPLAVAKSMPNLRHLQFFGNKMTNEGLVAILDGCPYLEALDLRQCFGIDLTDDVLKIRSQQIPVLKCPLDSTIDYERDAEIYEHEMHDFNTMSLRIDSNLDTILEVASSIRED